MKTSVNQFTDNINGEFLKIWNNLQTHIDDDNSIQTKKLFLSNHVPKEVILYSELLLDTVINALMDEAISQIEGANTQLQNKFYDHNFRNLIKEWASHIENKFSLEPEYVQYSTSPQLINGLIASGITFIMGSAVTVFAFFPELLIAAIVGGIVTLFLSAAAFKFASNRSEPKAIIKIKNDIEQYLETSKSQTTDWLEKVIDAFDKEFNKFCKENGWEVK